MISNVISCLSVMNVVIIIVTEKEDIGDIMEQHSVVHYVFINTC